MIITIFDWRNVFIYINWHISGLHVDLKLNIVKHALVDPDPFLLPIVFDPPIIYIRFRCTGFLLVAPGGHPWASKFLINL